METSEDIRKGNKLIAEFMGYTYYGHNDCRLVCTTLDPYHTQTYPAGWKKTPRDSNMRKLNRKGEHYLTRNDNGLRYFNEWDWIMPVVEKIAKLGNYVEISLNYAEISIGYSHFFINRATDETTWIELVWTSVVEFIEFYNTLEHGQEGVKQPN